MHNYVENISMCITNITNHFDQSIPSSILMWTQKNLVHMKLYTKKSITLPSALHHTLYFAPL